MTTRRVLVTVVLAVLLAGSPGLGMARQDASPSASPVASPVASPEAADGEALDLAAMVLDAGHVPSDYRLITEAYADVEAFSTQYTGGAIAVEELEATGFIRFYQSQYSSTDGQQTIRSYASEYATEEGATGGFDLLEDESRLLPPQALPPGSEVEDRPGPDVGEAPKETTFAHIPGFMDSLDATFRVDRVVVGVAVETTGATAPDAALAGGLAQALFDRVESVLAGEAPDGVDFALPATLLSLAELGPVSQAGYLRVSEILPGADADGSAYVQTASLGFPSDPTTPVVFITTGVLSIPPSTRAEPESALAEIGASSPVSILPIPTDSPRQPIPAVEIAGAESTAAFRAALLPGGFLDSARVTFAVGDRIGVVEVAGAATSAEAEATARDLAEQQAACLATLDPCTDGPAAAEVQASALRPAGGVATDGAPVAVATATSEEEAARQALFNEVWTTVKQHYLYRTGTENAFYVGYEGVNWLELRAEYEPRALTAPDDEAFYAVIGEMVARLGDDHSRYRSPAQAAVDDAYFSGQAVYRGIGVVIISGLDPARTGVVVYVFPDSPAERAGIQRRDRIVAVEGEPFTTERYSELVSELISPAGPPDVETSEATPAASEVRLTVASPGAAPRELTVERGIGDAHFAPLARRLDAAPGIGYLWIPELATPDMGPQIEEALAGMLAEGPLDGLILDLRSNPGGFIDPAVNQFVAGEIGRFYTRDGTPGQPYVVAAGGLLDELADVPLVVLVDNRSNSAAEIAAAALQAQGRALVVGIRSPGNVEAVPTYDFADGSRLYLASLIFRIPGQDIEATGVVPDLSVNVEWTAYAEADDPQILTAVELLEAGEVPTGATPVATPAD